MTRTLAIACWLTAGGCAGGDAADGGQRTGSTGRDQFDNPSTGAGGSSDFGGRPVQAGTGAPDPVTREPMDLEDGEVCDAEAYSGERKRLDMYMMVDDSGSMVPWWIPTLDAISQFLMDAGSAGIGVGVQFFGSTCDANSYATPAVPIAELPGHAATLSAAFPVLPIEGTATLPAMQGAISHARAWAMQHPEAKVVVLLVTDGLPSECGSTVDNVVQAIEEGYNGSPSIQTFAIGIGDLGALDRFAQAGGTDKALLAEPGAAQALVTALNEIRSAALPCEFRLPPGHENEMAAAQGRVNLRYTDLAGEQHTIGAVADASACDPARGGWYYDDPAAPAQLIACEQSCDQLNAGGEVKVLLGCPTVDLAPN